MNNQALFTVEQTFCPTNDREQHLAGLGLHRLDFERTNVAGNVLFRVEDNDEPGLAENKITTIGYLTRRFGNSDDAVAFLTSLHNICGIDTDNISQQTTASHYLREMQTRSRAEVLKEMGLLGFEMQAINAERDEEEETRVLENIVSRNAKPVIQEPLPKLYPIYLSEVAAVQKQIRRSRKVFVNDDDAQWLEGYEGAGFTEEEAFEIVEGLAQYDENGMIKMSDNHRPVTVGEMDVTDYDRHSVPSDLYALISKAYVYSQDNSDFWFQMEAHVDDDHLMGILRELHADFNNDLHMKLMRNTGIYRGFHTRIRQAKDVKEVGAILREAFQAKESKHLSLQAFTMLTTSGRLQQERLSTARDLPLAFQLKKQIAECKNLPKLVQEMKAAGHPIHTLPTQQQARVWDAVPTLPQATYLLNKIEGLKLPQLKAESWKMYGANDTNHPIHSLPPAQTQKVWAALNSRKQALGTEVAVA